DENDPCSPVGINTTDSDGDGLTDCEETTGIDDPSTPTVPTGTSDENDPCSPVGINTTDSDGDGLTDCEETTGIDDPSTPTVPTGTSDENDPCSPVGINTTDSDGDGLTDCEETTGIDDPSTPTVPTGTSDENDPCSPVGINTTDSDGDGLTDCEETTGIDDPSTPTVPTGTSDENDPCSPVGINTTDSDGDGLTDCEETTGIDDPSTPTVPTGTSNPNDICDPITTGCDVSIEVTKTAQFTDTELGDIINYTIEVQNTGDITLTDIVLVDTFLDGYGVEISLTEEPTFDSADQGSVEGTLLAGETATYYASFTITQSAIDSGGVSNSVIATGASQSTGTVSDTSDDGDDLDNNTIDDPTVTDLGCLTVVNEFSPNDDGIQDTLEIRCIDNYPNNKIEVYNRWGNIVYEQRGYNSNNQWDGTSNGRATVNTSDKLPVGTYYYVLDLGDGSKPKAGWLYINR
ncbi:gliding motility-associated C-terminal domain-containing protein, partial [Algibacter sp. PT7-4]|uniref:T9SS type B sorting domain-containing protein n=3 Tax=Algibacter ulvanivorans TaxID=3400999 RepID=UPI003AAB520B